MCRRYRKQIRFLQQAVRDLRGTLEADVAGESLSSEARERIHEAMGREGGTPSSRS